MPETPFRPRIKIGSLRQTTKKIMTPKVGSGKVSEEKFKQFLKEEKGLRRMAYGDKTSTVESWRGRHYLKDAKEKIKGSQEYRETLYGRKTTASQEFKDTVREEIRQEQATQQQGPTKEELAAQKRVEEMRKELHQFERSREIEKEMGRPLSGPANPDPNAPKVSVSDALAKQAGPTGSKQTGKTVSLAGGIPQQTLHKQSSGTATVPSVFSSAAASQIQPLPPIFGLRGRVLQVDTELRGLKVKILNAPPELAVFIGRDRMVQVPEGISCWREQRATALSEIKVADHVDVRGKIVNEEFVADEIYVNRGDLPDFVMKLSNSRPSEEAPTETPVDLAIG